MKTFPAQAAAFVCAAISAAIAAAAATSSIPAGSANAGAARVTIGMPAPQAQLGKAGATADVSEPLRQSLLEHLRGASVDVISLESRDAQQVDAEAAQKHVTYVLYTRVEQKHPSGFGSMLSKLGPLTNALPMLGGRGGGLAGAATQVATQSLTQSALSATTAGAQQAMAQMAGAQQSSIKSGDTVTVDYRLVAPGSTSVRLASTLQGKAKSDGEDVLSPMVAQIANAVAATATPPSPTPAASPAPGANRAGVPDCATMAAMPHSVFTVESCEKMMASKQAYETAAADPSAARPGDEQMSCEQITAELKAQSFTAPDKATAAALQSSTAEEQATLGRQQAELAKTGIAQQAAIDAAVASDRATELASGGLVNTHKAAALTQTFAAQNHATGERMAEERNPNEKQVFNSASDLGVGAAQEMSANPRLARLTQLASAKRCKRMS